MALKSIVHLDRFKIRDEKTQETYFGGKQEWYGTVWQRRAGCGPTVATNLFSYLKNHLASGTGEIANESANASAESFHSKAKWVELMEELWTYVTPSIRGVNTTKMFYEPFQKYAQSKGFDVEVHFCDIPEEKAGRPPFSEVRNFILEGLEQDAPVAFLNLCNGEEKNLDRWHWVTIVALEDADEGDKTFVKILDEGKIKKIDLQLWFNTTTLGGGFVYFTLRS